MRRLIAALAFLALVAAAPAPVVQTNLAPVPAGGWPADKVDIVIRGTISGADHETYRRLPFTVPAGVERVTVAFAYTGRDDKTVIDVGLFDGERFRGWSGGSRSLLTVSADDATPGYLAGPVRPGRWAVQIGLPNVRATSKAAYEARIYFDRPAADPPLKAQPGWYRGDLHMHTAHSDGRCAAQDGVRRACPVYRTVEAAARRGLDFIAITDHNTSAHFEAIRELQPAFPNLLLLPGREVTTFQGHANVFGATGFIDFRLGSPTVPTIEALFRQAGSRGGLVSINHPALASGEACMGCGWTAGAAGYGLVEAVEAINGSAIERDGVADGTRSGVSFWQARLNEGRRVTGIGGSDNHDAGLDPAKPPAIGRPTTVVFAADLSTPGILAGIRSGRVFIDIDGTTERRLEFSAQGGPDTVQMGGDLRAPRGMDVRFEVRLAGLTDGKIDIIADGKPFPATIERQAGGGEQALVFHWPSDGARHWLRVDARTADGRLVLLGNPIYVNFKP